MIRTGGSRAVALEALSEIERDASFADDVLDRHLSKAGLDGRDRALAFELAYGVLRHKATLDWRLAQVSNRPLDRLPRFAVMALRLAAYQLLYLERIPASAAVNESVALVKSRQGQAAARDWSGFVNAVLRSLIRTPAPPWPDPQRDPVSALSVRYACPPWLTARWLARLGQDRAEALCRATLAIPPLTIRTNRLKTTREALLESLTGAGLVATPTKVSPVGLVLEKCGPVADLPQFQAGLFYVEDEAGQLVAPLLDPQPDERILDACAAPGSKATHLATLMGNRGEVVAVDRHPTRLRRIDENCRRMGITIVTTVAADATAAALHPDKPPFDRPFDRILLDAPCSGLGVLRRHPEGKWQKDESGLAGHRTAQQRLLHNVGRLLRPGGVLVYSTCSTEPDENEAVVERFCRQETGFRRESVAPWLPDSGRESLTAQGNYSTLLNSHSMDVFFAARLRKADDR